MRNTFIIFAVVVATLCGACSNSPKATEDRTTVTTQTPVKTPFVPKNGDYPGKGKITKINNELGSVELKHEEIKDVMPAMQMEFFVSDKSLLKGLNVGDNAEFILRYNNGQETIISLSKTK